MAHRHGYRHDVRGRLTTFNVRGKRTVYSRPARLKRQQVLVEGPLDLDLAAAGAGEPGVLAVGEPAVGEGVVQVGHERHRVVALLARELAVGAGVRDDDP